MEKDKVSRRQFLNALLGTGLFAGLLGSVYAAVRYVIPPDVPEASPSMVVAARVGELNPGTAKIFRFGAKPGLLLRLPDGSYRAFSAICTHLDCTVQYRSDMAHIWCACHDGHYDLNGVNISGPPPRPLDKFGVIIKGEEIFVSREG
ncbi:MAG: Rieske (2Fe-2S) protein [Candidatus Eiseniibacteriota bacterium]|nr:MAG: Rieske (2Fe-2S) protein [Candidatus Eisenbacteria bacterium]